jgi:hypothetical protein
MMFKLCGYDAAQECQNDARDERDGLHAPAAASKDMTTLFENNENIQKKSASFKYLKVQLSRRFNRGNGQD